MLDMDPLSQGFETLFPVHRAPTVTAAAAPRRANQRRNLFNKSLNKRPNLCVRARWTLIYFFMAFELVLFKISLRSLHKYI